MVHHRLLRKDDLKQRIAAGVVFLLHLFDHLQKRNAFVSDALEHRSASSFQQVVKRWISRNVEAYRERVHEIARHLLEFGAGAPGSQSAENKFGFVGVAM